MRQTASKRGRHSAWWILQAGIAVAISMCSYAQSVPVLTAGAASNSGLTAALEATSSISQVTSGGELLHVIVGHSLFLSMKSRLSRVYVADPNILNSVTLSPNQIVVTATAPGISSLVLLDENGQAQSYVVSSDVDLAGLRTAMSEAMHGNVVNIEGNGGRVTLSGTVGSSELADTAVKLAGLYSKDVGNALSVAQAHPKQVRLKVRILEVDRTKALQMGVNLFNPGGNSSFLASATTSQYPSTATISPSPLAGNNVAQVATTNPLNFMLYSAKLDLGATIQDLESKQILQILAEPTITTLSGQKANFLSGGEFPFPIVQSGGTGSTPVVTIQFRQYGVKLEFTPIVNDDGTIHLTVAPEVSSLDYTNSVTIGGFTIPALSTRRAETQVELRNDQSFAISGLLDQRTTDLLNKTPGIASVPILGTLFKSKNVNHSTSELVVIVTPTLVDPLGEVDEPGQPTLAVPTLNQKDFDNSLGKDKNPHPAAPPINPDEHDRPSGVTRSPGDAASGVSAAISGNATSGLDSSAHSMVQIMTLSSREDAESVAAALERAGYKVNVSHDPAEPVFHLVMGPFETTLAAESMRHRLVLDGYNAIVR